MAVGRSSKRASCNERSAVANAARLRTKAAPESNGHLRDKAQRKHAWQWRWIAEVSIALGFVSLIFLMKRNDHDGSGWAGLTIDDTDKSSLAFVEWFKQHGGVMRNVTLSEFEGMGKGVVALRKIRAGDEMLFVPRDLIIDTESMLKHTNGRNKEILRGLQERPEEMMTAFLVLEYLRGVESFWFPYLQALPTVEMRHHIASPLFYDDSKIVQELQDRRLIAASLAERRRTDFALKRFRTRFKDAIRSLDSALLELTYKWMRFLVSSRAFSINGARYLVPFGDFFNGKQHSKDRSHANGQHFLRHHRLSPKGMSILADRDTLQSQQVLEDYGDNDNYLYFLHHGFLMQDNKFDCATVDLPRFESQSTAKASLRANILRQLGVPDRLSICVYGTGTLDQREIRAFELYSFVADMSEADIERCSSPEHVRTCFSSVPRSIRNRVLVTNLQAHMASFPTSLDEDERILNELGATDSQSRTGLEHAVMFRRSRKIILMEAVKALHVLEQSKPMVNEHQSASQVPQGEEAQVRDDHVKIHEFNKWIQQTVRPSINHLRLQYIDEVLGFGVVAAQHLAPGDVYLSIREEFVMNSESAMRSEWVRSVSSTIGVTTPDHPRNQEILLLLHLLEEKFAPHRQQEGKQSFWKPYLDILPDETLSPVFYDENQLSLLVGSELYKFVDEYRKRVLHHFDILEKRLDDVDRIWITQDRFVWASAILDSRSIWWSGRRHLVPLLDMVNCMEIDPSQPVHHTDLEGNEAVTRASWTFETGQQVVENYGQPNYIYLLYHGFVLPEGQNQHDCALLRFHIRHEEIEPALRRHLIQRLETLEFRSWAPDICVRVNDENSIQRLIQVAALEREALDSSKMVESISSSQRIQWTIDAIDQRVAKLTEQPSDSESRPSMQARMILSFRTQQVELMRELRQYLSNQLGRVE